jgi:undecaprenyl-diphosphatase
LTQDAAATRARLAPLRLALAAALAFVLFIVMGAAVAHRPPGALDRATGAFFFHQAEGAATLFTEAGLFPAYAAFGVAALVLGFVRRAALAAAIVSIASLVIAWQVGDVFKVVFHRPRPAHWLFMHETSWSYPSGHAVNVIAFWGVWFGVLLAGRPSPWRTVGLVAIPLWVLGIVWSRLALGAHYLTDVVGGCLFGFVCASAAAIALGWLQPVADTARATER